MSGGTKDWGPFLLLNVSFLLAHVPPPSYLGVQTRDCPRKNVPSRQGPFLHPMGFSVTWLCSVCLFLPQTGSSAWWWACCGLPVSASHRLHPQEPAVPECLWLNLPWHCCKAAPSHHFPMVVHYISLSYRFLRASACFTLTLNSFPLQYREVRHTINKQVHTQSAIPFFCSWKGKQKRVTGAMCLRGAALVSTFPACIRGSTTVYLPSMPWEPGRLFIFSPSQYVSKINLSESFLFLVLGFFFVSFFVICSN